MAKSEEFYENLYLQYFEETYPQLSKPSLARSMGGRYKKALTKKGLILPTTFVQLHEKDYALALFEEVNPKNNATLNDCLLTLIHKVWMHKYNKGEELDGRFASENGFKKAKTMAMQNRDENHKAGSRFLREAKPLNDLIIQLSMELPDWKEVIGKGMHPNDKQKIRLENMLSMIEEHCSLLVNLHQQTQTTLKESRDATNKLNQTVVQLKLVDDQSLLQG